MTETLSTPVNICVIGSGYVGLVAAVCFAETGHNVLCVDNDEQKVAGLSRGEVPIYENYLTDLLAKHLNKGVHFTTNLHDAVGKSEAVFIAVGTPQSSSGSADLSFVEAVVSEIARGINSYKVIVEKSTVPVYTHAWIRRVLSRYGIEDALFDVVSNPEFLREGTAVVDFLHPDRIVVGAETPRAAEVLRRIYAPLTTGEYYRHPNAVAGPMSAENPAPILVTSPQSAEIIKHASNSFLALKISFINAVSTICESVGADVDDVSRGMGLDARIGPRFLRAGIGYGGSCFPKDLTAFHSVAQQQGIDFKLLSEVQQINEQQKRHFFQKIHSTLWTLRGKKVAALGLAFKGETDDIRDSPAIDIVKMLLDAGCRVSAYDPAAMGRTQESLKPNAHLQYATDEYAAAEGADALLILTDWPQFALLDLERLKGLLKFPIMIDGRNLYDYKGMRDKGFTYVSIGRPASHSGFEGIPRANFV
jgi:UDPglucose 6-dehydrogenase